MKCCVHQPAPYGYGATEKGFRAAQFRDGVGIEILFLTATVAGKAEGNAKVCIPKVIGYNDGYEAYEESPLA